MKSREYLQQVSKLNRMIENKIIEKEQWKAMAMSTACSSGDGIRVKSSGSQQKMEEAVCKYVDMEHQLDEYIDMLVDKKNEVIETLELLPEVEYDVLHKLYIQFRSYDDVAAIYGKSYTWVTTIHGRSLKHLQNILDQRKEVCEGAKCQN